jgi:hypothetical protein
MKHHLIMIGVAAVVLYFVYRHFQGKGNVGENSAQKAAIYTQEMGAEISNWQL